MHDDWTVSFKAQHLRYINIPADPPLMSARAGESV